MSVIVRKKKIVNWQAVHWPVTGSERTDDVRKTQAIFSRPPSFSSLSMKTWNKLIVQLICHRILKTGIERQYDNLYKENLDF